MPFTAFQPAHHAFRFSNKFANNVGLGPISVTTKGRCGGMVYAALDYFYAGVRIPNRVDLPPDGDPVADFIMLRQVTSMVGMGPMFLTKLAQQAAPHIELPLGGHVGPGLSSAEQFQSGVDYVDGICIAVDAGQPIVLGLLPLDFDPSGNHQVLAIGYDHHPDRAQRRVHIYDPNHPAEVTTLTPDPRGKRFIDNFGKSWRTLFNDDSYKAMDPPPLATPTPAAGFGVSRIPDHLDLFWTGPDRAIGSTVSNPSVTGGGWSGAYPLTPPGAARAKAVVSCASRTPDHLDLFWLGGDQAIGSTFWNRLLNNGAWTPPFPLTPPRAAREDSPVASVARLTHHLDVFWIGPDGAIGTTFWDALTRGGGWNTPFAVSPAGAAGAGSGLSAIARSPHHIDLFWVGPDGAIGSTFWDKDVNGGQWNGPFPITPPAAARPHSPVVAVARMPHHIDVFWIGPDGAIGSTFWNRDINGGRWNAPFPVTPSGAAGPGSALSALARMPHHVDLFWLGGDRAIGSTFWNKDSNGGRWHPPFPVSPTAAARADSPITAVARTFEHLDVFWIGPDGAIGTTFSSPAINSGGWNMPFPVTPPAAAG